MKFIDRFLKKSSKITYPDDVIVAAVSGKLIPASHIHDEVFSKEIMGKTIGLEPLDGTVVAPANGVLEVVYPTGHAFAVRANNGMSLLVHIGIDTVNLQGKGFSILKKQGDTVNAGEPVIVFDLKLIKQLQYDPVIIMAIMEADSLPGEISYIEYSDVQRGQVITL